MMRQADVRTWQVGRVLVVEDESITRHRLLSALGDFLVHSVETVQRAEVRLRQQDYDVILAEEQLPDGRGLPLLRYAQSRSPATIGILVAGSTSDPEITAARSTWRQLQVLGKPCDARQVRKTVEQSVEKARLRAASLQLTRCR
jgi:DNA-binding NtrC family response regulator